MRCITKAFLIIMYKGSLKGLGQQYEFAKNTLLEELRFSCCRTAVGVGQRALSLRPHGEGDPLPTPGFGEGDVTTPAFRGTAGTSVASLLRGTGGFSTNHLSESLNPFIHTGGPRRGCSLSLWRVVRGSKLMHLDLIHGLFIT